LGTPLIEGIRKNLGETGSSLRTGSGGGLLRDIITREEPLVFKPGQFLCARGARRRVMFVFCSVMLDLAATPPRFAAVAITFTSACYHRRQLAHRAVSASSLG